MRKLLPVIALAIAALAGCSSNDTSAAALSSSKTAATATTTSTTKVAVATTTAAKITTTTMRPTTTTTQPTARVSTTESKSVTRNVLPTQIADDTIITGDDFSRSCNPNTTNALSLPRSGTVQGLAGNIGVVREAAYIKIMWDNRGAETIIVNGSLWGYVRAEDGSMPSAIFLYGGTGRWGAITNLSKAATLVACVRK